MKKILISLLLLLGLTFFVIPPVDAVEACRADTSANDEVGQSDLTLLCYDFASLPTSYQVSVSFDKTRFTGNNTGDACALFDTNSDTPGLIDYAICFQVGGDPGTIVPTSPFAYQCLSPNSDVSCGTAAFLPLTGGTTCTSTTSNDDPFSTGENYPFDTKVTCTINSADIPAGGLQVNACTYPSASPTSDPKDCLLDSDSGQLVLIKDADGDASTNFNFSTSSTSFSRSDSILGDGSVFFDLLPGTYSIDEITPDNWGVTSIACEDRTGASVGTVDLTNGSISNLPMTKIERIICTFTNRQESDLEITKSDTLINYTPGLTNQVYTIAVINNGPANLSGAVVTDTIPDGLTINSVSCNVGATCSIGQSGQDITVTMDIDNQETVVISVNVSYSTDPSAY